MSEMTAPSKICIGADTACEWICLSLESSEPLTLVHRFLKLSQDCDGMLHQHQRLSVNG